MAEKKALLVLADALDLNGSGEALDKLKKKAAVLSHADAAGLKDLAVALGGVCAGASGIEAAFEADAALVIVEGADALSPALEAADRRTLVVVVSASGTAFYGLAVNPKAGIVGRAVNAQDIAVTIATIADLPADPAGDAADELAVLVAALEPPDREIFLRKYYLMQSSREIAAALDLRVSTVNTRLSRGRDRLRRQLQERGYTHG